MIWPLGSPRRASLSWRIDRAVKGGSFGANIYIPLTSLSTIYRVLRSIPNPLLSDPALSLRYLEPVTLKIWKAINPSHHNHCRACEFGYTRNRPSLVCLDLISLMQAFIITQALPSHQHRRQQDGFGKTWVVSANQAQIATSCTLSSPLPHPAASQAPHFRLGFQANAVTAVCSS